LSAYSHCERGKYGLSMLVYSTRNCVSSSSASSLQKVCQNQFLPFGVVVVMTRPSRSASAGNTTSHASRDVMNALSSIQRMSRPAPRRFCGSSADLNSTVESSSSPR
jgi:hypothetical protein